MEKIVKIIGGGLAGCECAYQLAKRGVKVKLYDIFNLSNTIVNAIKNVKCLKIREVVNN